MILHKLFNRKLASLSPDIQGVNVLGTEGVHICFVPKVDCFYNFQPKFGKTGVTLDSSAAKTEPLVKVIFVQNMAFTNTQGHAANIITMWGNHFEGI